MKKIYILNLVTVILVFLTVEIGLAQSTETFETETAVSTTFSDNGKTFNITSSTGEAYDVFTHGAPNGGGNDSCIGCGWNGTSADQKFVDNTGAGNHNGDNNGSSFTITPVGTEITVQSLYLFCSTRPLAITTGTLTITGNKGGNEVYSFSISSFASPVTFTPNNGFTFIDFSNQSGSDFSGNGIDELVISSTGDLDYMALDAFSWTVYVLSSDDVDLQDKKSIYPIPASDNIRMQNLNTSQDYIVYTITGSLVKEGVIKKSESINIQNLSNGIYFMRFKNGNKVYKFIKK